MVDDVVGPVGLRAVVDSDAGHLCDHAHRVHGHRGAPFVALDQGHGLSVSTGALVAMVHEGGGKLGFFLDVVADLSTGRRACLLGRAMRRFGGLYLLSRRDRHRRPRLDSNQRTRLRRAAGPVRGFTALDSVPLSRDDGRPESTESRLGGPFGWQLVGNSGVDEPLTPLTADPSLPHSGTYARAHRGIVGHVCRVVGVT